jgi:signal recognition particle subunit SEC65
MDYNHGIRNLGFKIIIFKEKKYPKLVDYIKNRYQIYYEKTIATISESVSEYENLSYEEKIIIDFILSINNLN